MKRKKRMIQAYSETKMSKPLLYRFLRFVYRKISFPAGIRYSLRTFFRRLFADEKRVSYRTWVELTRTLDQVERRTLEEKIRSLQVNPTFSLLVFIFEDLSPNLSRLLESVQAQIYPRWELLILTSASLKDGPILGDLLKKDERIRSLSLPKEIGTFSKALSYSFGQTTGEYLGLLGAEDSFSDSALLDVACALEKNPDLKLVYTDEDLIDKKGTRFFPVFKPDWSPELFLSQNYLGDLTIYHRDRLLEISLSAEWREKAGRFDLNLKFVSGMASSQIGHIPKVLYHSKMSSFQAKKSLMKNFLPEKFQPAPEGQKVLQTHLDKIGIHGQVEIGPKSLSYRIRYTLQENFKVSVVIPSTCKLSLLKPCIESLLTKTSYLDYEILIVVNEVSYNVSEQSDYLNQIQDDPKIKILVYEDQPFNYSKLNNWAIKHSDAPFVCLLNDDTEVISRNWLSEMVFWSRQEGVGAVGAKLYYPDGTIQHAGVTLGKEGGFHAFRFLPGDSDGYMGRLQTVCNYSAVTGACLVVRREFYERVGGLDEEAFPVAFNDIDFCLKLGDQGFRVVWTPYAELFHKESVSRGFDDTSEKEERFQKEFEVFKMRWKEKMEDDPFYNPNFSIESEDFSLIFPPRKRGSCFEKH